MNWSPASEAAALCGGCGAWVPELSLSRPLPEESKGLSCASWATLLDVGIPGSLERNILPTPCSVLAFPRPSCI